MPAIALTAKNGEGQVPLPKITMLSATLRRCRLPFGLRQHQRYGFQQALPMPSFQPAPEERFFQHPAQTRGSSLELMLSLYAGHLRGVTNPADRCSPLVYERPHGTAVSNHPHSSAPNPLQKLTPKRKGREQYVCH
jgi:hypothetical protein